MLEPEFKSDTPIPVPHPNPNLQSPHPVSSQIDQQKFLSETIHTFSQYESEISSLEASLALSPSVPADMSINQSHFSFKRSTTNHQTAIQIESQYLQDSVFSNLDFLHQQEMEKIFVEAKGEINRLTEILILRDNEIAGLKEESQKLSDSLVNTKDTDKRRREYQTLVQENSRLSKRVQELVGELNAMKTNRVEEQRRSTNVIRVNGGSSNRLSVAQDGNSLTSSVVSSRLRQKVSTSVQTEREPLNGSIIPPPFSTNNLQGLELELKNRTGQVNHLNNTLLALNQEFQSLKNDNYLFLEDLEKGKGKIDELEKIIKVQNQHIDGLRAEAKSQENRHKEAIDRLRRDLDLSKERQSLGGGSVSHSIIPSPQSSGASDSRMISELRSEISKLKIEVSNAQSSNKSLNGKVELLTTQNTKLSAEANTSKSQYSALNNELVQSKSQNITLSNELSRVKSENQQLLSEKSQLQSQVRTIVAHQPNTDVLKKNSEQLLVTIKSLESRILQLSKVEQESRESKQEIRRLNSKIGEKERQLASERVKCQQQIAQNQQLLSRASQKDLKGKNGLELGKDNQLLQERLEIMRNQMILKNNMIEGLERKTREQQKIIEIYKSEFNSKNKGIVGFGTSNSLTDKSPQRVLQIQSPQELISASKNLLSRGSKGDNSQDLYNILALMTEQFQIMRNEYFNNPDVGLLVNGEPYSSHHSSHQSNRSAYQQEINTYIASLLNKISDHQNQLDLYEDEINKLRFQLDSRDPHHFSDERNWEQLQSDLQFECKLTQKLSDHVKQLKQQILNLNEQLEEKNDEIYELSSRIYTKKGDLKEIDIHLGDVQNQYQRLLNHQKSVYRRSVDADSHPGSETVRELLDEIESYRQELEKAVNLNEQLKECLRQERGECCECQQYQILVEDLESRLQNYEKLMMGELKRIFTSCEKEINRKERLTIHSRISNLREKTNIKSPPERSFDVLKPDSPKVAKRKYIHLGHANNQPRTKVLSTVVANEKLSLETLLVLMSKVLEQVDNQRFHQHAHPLQLDNILVTGFDKSNPEAMTLQISENKTGDRIPSRTYLAPELLKGGEATRKSLIWNIGLLFHEMINKKPFFTKESEIMDNNYCYRYQNKLFPELRGILEGMLQKDSGRRKIFSQLRNIVNNELSRLRMSRGRG